MSTIVIGVDVSKKTLDLAWEEAGKTLYFKTSNDGIGFKDIMKKCPQSSHFVMEATGVYHSCFATAMHSKSYLVSVVNPLVIKRFSDMKLRRAKTDKADAHLISDFGRLTSPDLWTPPAIELLEMEQLLTLSEKIITQKQSLLNQLEAFSSSSVISKKAVSTINKTVKVLEKEVKNINTEIERIAKENYSRELEILVSIPGIGNKTAINLLVSSRNFKEFRNGRNLCSFLGITPQISQSGTSINSRGNISKMGQARARKLLYMCALTAMSKNEGCRLMYTRFMEKGKPAKVALVAIMAKLVRQAVAMIKADQLFSSEKTICSSI